MTMNDTRQPPIPSDPYDVVIVGGGAAGLSAALVLGRARRRVVVVDAGHPRNAPAAHMQGFLGSDGLPPAELLGRGRNEVARYGVDQVSSIVTGIRPCATAPDSTWSRRRFHAALEDGATLETRAVLVTTGLRRDPRHSRRSGAVGTGPAALPLLPRLRSP
jgi:thioredoxin reductase